MSLSGMNREDESETIDESKVSWSEGMGIWAMRVVSSIAFVGGIVGLIASIVPKVFDLVAVVAPYLTQSLALDAILLLLFSAIGFLMSSERAELLGKARRLASIRHREATQKMDDLNKEIARVRQVLTTSVSCRTLMGPEEIYEESIELVESCKGTEIILATSLGNVLHEEEETPYGRYLEALAKKIGETQQQNVGMLYRVVMGFQPNKEGEPPPEKQGNIRRRRELFKKYGVPNKMQIGYLETTWSLDLFIVGNEHMILGFPAYGGDREIRLAIRITDKNFVPHVALWYNDHLWREAKLLTWTEKEHSHEASD